MTDSGQGDRPSEASKEAAVAASERTSKRRPPRPTSVGLNPPQDGFSRGTIQGLIVCGLLLLILLPVTLGRSIQPQGAGAVTLDFVAGLFAAVAVVWVVGGLFQFEGKLLDVSVKAAGGAAVMLILVVWVRPYYKVLNYYPHSIEISLGEQDTLDVAIREVESERRAGAVDVEFNFGGNEKDIRRFSPSSTRLLTYSGDSWLDIFAEIAKDSSNCLKIQNAGNLINMALDKSKTKETKLDGQDVVTCN